MKLVQTSDGKPIKIKYQPEAYFQSNIERHLYASGLFVWLADFSFEIDDEGTPSGCDKIEKKIGFSGNDAVGIILVNAQTGEIKEHSIVTTPSWVDRIHRLISSKQLNDWGIMYMDIEFSKQIADYWRID
jgi:hypothetical protein